LSATGFRYDFVVDQSQANNTHNMTIAAIGGGKRVLDVGCSTGYLAEFLTRDRGCEVHGLEPDVEAAAAARARLGDRIRTGGTALLDTYPPGSFDVVLFADVLEHLMDPGQALRDTRRLLAPGGRVIASIPNCAHGDLRLLLLAGHFSYQRTGLLDSTHVRFLTRHSIPTMFSRSGYRVEEMRAKTVPLGRTEFGLNLDFFPPEVLATVVADPHHADYQYIVSAAPDELAAPAQFRAATGWQRTDLVTRWAGAFSPAEPVRLALPVADDDAAVTAAVEAIEVQCLSAGVTVDTVADIELVRCDGELELPGWALIQPDWNRAALRAQALPTVDVLVV
jgi:2-polyprenyl-3-methyl-5-hydroxy-6-metoxy-1,4-benzoquinol methylase